MSPGWIMWIIPRPKVQIDDNGVQNGINKRKKQAYSLGRLKQFNCEFRLNWEAIDFWAAQPKDSWLQRNIIKYREMEFTI